MFWESDRQVLNQIMPLDVKMGHLKQYLQKIEEHIIKVQDQMDDIESKLETLIEETCPPKEKVCVAKKNTKK